MVKNTFLKTLFEKSIPHQYYIRNFRSEDHRTYCKHEELLHEHTLPIQTKTVIIIAKHIS